MKSLITLLILLLGAANGQACIPGTINFISQAQIDAFTTNFPGCTTIEGNVIIQGADITNLNGLSGVTSIGGNLTLQNNDALTSLGGLTSLVSIGGWLSLTGNDALTDLSGLEAVTSVGLGLFISQNNVLTSLSGLTGLTTLGSSLIIQSNPVLTGLTGLDALISVGEALHIQQNAALISLDGLSALSSIGDDLRVNDNGSLTTLTSLDALTTISGNLFINSNPVLEDIAGFSNLTAFSGLIDITFNSALTDISGLNGFTTCSDITIGYNSSLTVIDGLNGITQASSLNIYENNALTSITGFSSLVSIDYVFGVNANLNLTDISGFNALTTVYYLSISSNILLPSLNGLNALTSVLGFVDLSDNHALTNLTGLESLSSIGEGMSIQGNLALTDISALSALTNLGTGDLYILENPLLTSLTGLENIPASVFTYINIGDNAGLSVCNLGNICEFLANGGAADIYGNAPGCEDIAAIAANCLTCFADSDGDGYGDPTVSQYFGGACGSGFVLNDLDCDDSDPALNPNTLWYLDADSDNYYTGSGLAQCLSPGSGYRMSGLTGGGDCNDSNAAVNPGATETCNGVDDNCDGTTDEGLTFTTYYQDADSDGFGNPSATQSTCDGPPAGYITTAGDCDDGDPAVNPNGTETCNGVDDNCDGTTDEGLTFTTYYQDADSDGFGNPSATQSTCDGPPAGYIAASGDCDDTNVNVNPNGVESTNGLDDNCDGIVDNVAAGDLDGDGFPDADDCRPLDPNSYPGAPEICGDLVDNDCDGLVDDPLVILLISEQEVVCYGGNDGSIEVAGQCGLPPYTYQWSNGATTAAISNLTSGLYRVTVTDSQGLTRNRNFNIQSGPYWNIAFSVQNILCHGETTGALTANPYGPGQPFTYLWSTGATTQTITGLSAGTYIVTVTSADGCTRSRSSSVYEPNLLTLTPIISPIPNAPGVYAIFGSAFWGSPYPGSKPYRYRMCSEPGGSCTNWTPGGFTYNFTYTATPGAYTLQVRDRNGCITTQVVTVGAAREEGEMDLPELDFPTKLAETGLELHPNPVASEFWLTLRGKEGPEQESTVEIYDITGSIVLRREMTVVSEAPARIDVSELAAGTYVLFLRGVEAPPVRFVIQRL